MTKKSDLDLSLFADQPHTWNDDLTEDMSQSEKTQYLAKAARECMVITEHEVAYGILRELLELEPCLASEYWRMLEECCRHLEKPEEAEAAVRNARVLE